MYFVGIDIGSLSTDGVIAKGGAVVGQRVIPTGSSSESAGASMLSMLLEDAKIRREDVSKIVTTGYGRRSVDFTDKAVTEITCHALGAKKLFPEARTVIDIGGQDSKVIVLEPDGRVADFAMNDKCAAGCGRFLEVMASALGMKPEDMGDAAAASAKEVVISGVCTVFAESEVVGLVAKGVPPEDIVKGLCLSVARRVGSMAARLKAKGPFVLTGGVAKNGGVAEALSGVLKSEVFLPREPQTVGALGASIIAERL
ncbi:MAG: 2-hydroxyglutaryl-CoA dehydratase [Abditibacteriota bacterium]|nr:2-hydroxyglutaryl-CoA dehydratase [Abditibacteriota bacterium]